MDLAGPSPLPISPSPDISHISETNMDISLKKLKKEKKSESDLSNLSAIVSDDSSDDIMIPETQNDAIPESPKQPTTQSIKPPKHTKGPKKYTIVIPETQTNKSKKEPPSPLPQLSRSMKRSNKNIKKMILIYLIQV